MAEVWKHNVFYTLLRPAVNLCAIRSYRHLQIVGKKENFPREGAVILAPNHCNALMDAVDILVLEKGPIVFGSRADIFRKKAIAAILNFLKIIPIPRARDGVEALREGGQSVHIATGTLLHGVPFCLYSEGTHRTMHSLLPIKKGIVRIALDAASKTDGPVRIVPVGLEYGDYYRYRGTLLMTVGEPIDVKEIIASNEGQSEAVVQRKMAEELHRRLEGLISYLPDDESYESHLALLRFLSAGFKGRLSERMALNRRTIEVIEDCSKRFPREMKALCARALALDAEKKKRKVSILSFGIPRPGLRALGRAMQLLIGLPFFLWSTVVSLPVLVAAEVIGHLPKDRAFLNSLRFGVRLAGMPLMYIVWAALFFSLLPWQAAVALFAISLASCSVFYDYCELVRLFVSDASISRHPELRKAHSEILKRYATLMM